MANAQRLKLTFQQTLTPQQIQLVRLLQMPISSMEQALKEEVERNPMLEEQEPKADYEALPQGENPDEEENRFEDGFSLEDDEDYAYRERLEHDPNMPQRSWEVSADTSQQDSLLEQFHYKELTPLEVLIGDEIIGSIDASGYLGRDVGLIANDLAYRQGIEVSPQEVEQVLTKVQSLEPAGIAARNLQECLALQLSRLTPQTFVSRCALAIVEQCYEAFTQRSYSLIQTTLEIDEEPLQQAVDLILHLNPKPGSAASEDEAAVQYVVPDFVVIANEGELTLAVNDAHLPELQISTYYQEMLLQLTANSNPTPAERETINFIKENSLAAKDFISNLALRHDTLREVLQIIVQRQRDYFLSGNTADLHPMLQKEVATEIGLDESTVSRIVGRKYVQTSFGTILLKDLFSKPITTDDGEVVAVEKVKRLIMQSVEQEDKTHPLSDEALSAMLKEHGFTVARRTVAKHRVVLGIPMSKLRKVLTVVLLVLLCGIGQPLRAQAYFDSIHNAKINKASAAAARLDSATKAAKETSKQGDTIVNRSAGLAQKIYPDGVPALMWYGSDFSDRHVRLKCMSMDSLPDQLTIRLVQQPSEFCFPVKNIITSPYGWRWNRPHRGVDIRLNIGDPVHCVFDGVVRIAKPMGAYGNLVVVRHYNGLETVYGHLSKIKVKPYQQVKAGEVLGLGGSTGRSTGPHLHFEVRFQYEAFDPEWILDFKTYTLRTRKLHIDKTYFGITKPRNKADLAYKADKSIIREQPEAQRKRPGPKYHTMRKGENLKMVAARYNTTPEKIKALNAPWEKPKVGQDIRVK